MKTSTLKKIVAGFILASVWAAPAIVGAEPPSGSDLVGSKAPAADRASISGKITNKTAAVITVAGQTVEVATTTAITKDGATLSLGDLKVGDQVAVLTAKSDDGRIVALKVEVLSAA